MSSAIADLVDSRYPFIDVVSVCSLWPCLMDDRNPQVAFMAAVRHVGPEAQREVRDYVVCGRVLAKAVSQVVYRIPVQSVGVVDLSSLIRPENRAPYGRGIVKQPVVGPAPSGGYCPVVSVSEGRPRRTRRLSRRPAQGQYSRGRGRVRRRHRLAILRDICYIAAQRATIRCAPGLFSERSTWETFPRKIIEPRRLESAVVPGLTNFRL